MAKLIRGYTWSHRSHGILGKHIVTLKMIKKNIVSFSFNLFGQCIRTKTLMSTALKVCMHKTVVVYQYQVRYGS
jgi:hypothetical protein